MNILQSASLIPSEFNNTEWLDPTALTQSFINSGSYTPINSGSAVTPNKLIPITSNIANVPLSLAPMTLRGKVVDETGDGLLGATILIVGTQKGVVTDINGNFILHDVPSTAQISIRFLGYNERTMLATGLPAVIALSPETNLLDAVVVNATKTNGSKNYLKIGLIVVGALLAIFLGYKAFKAPAAKAVTI